jgi:hypothetical protein
MYKQIDGRKKGYVGRDLGVMTEHRKRKQTKMGTPPKEENCFDI